MIGTTFYSFGERENEKGLLIKEPFHKKSEIYSSSDGVIACTYYDYYPIRHFSYKTYIVVIEGLIFNYSTEEIDRDLKSSLDNGISKSILANMVKAIDGDFVVLIYDTKNKNVVVFNDELGGLPFHYYCEGSTFICSRSISQISVLAPELTVSKEHIAEYITFGYYIGDHTIYGNIKKIRPASILEASLSENGIWTCTEQDLVTRDYTLQNAYRSKNDAIKDLAQLYLFGTKNRVKYAEDNGYKIVNTMSGGYDSRMVIAALEKETTRYANLTYQYVQDESKIVKQVLSAINSNSEFIKQEYDNNPVYDDSRLSFITDGKVNVYTNSVCYNDINNVKNEIIKDEKVLYFGGFGGEYIRHPYYPKLSSIKHTGFTFSPSVKLSSSMLKIPYKRVENTIFSIFPDTVKSNKQAFYKFFYDDYYQQLVRCSGEDRTRLFFPTVQPLMSKDFILAVRNRLPLSWTGFGFCTAFLKELDERLVQLPFYGSHEYYPNEEWTKNKDFILKVKTVLRNYIEYWKIRLVKNAEITKVKTSYVPFDYILELFNKLNDTRLFDIKFIEGNYCFFDRDIQCRLANVLQFLLEVSKHREEIEKNN